MMNYLIKKTIGTPVKFLSFFLLLLVWVQPAQAWWDNEWTLRKKITLDTGDKGADISGPIGSGVVLIRLHDGNFQFSSGSEDGSDLRFVAEDDKTLLVHHVEKWDSLLSEGFVWVKIPDLQAGGLTHFWLYYGNRGGKAVRTDDVKGTYDSDTLLVYHFAEHGAPASDSTSFGNHAESTGVASDGSMIGTGLRMDGKSALTIPGSPSLEWSAGSNITWSAWIKPSALQPNAIIYSRRSGSDALTIGLDNGIPYVEVKSEIGEQKTTGGEALAVNSWKHLAMVANGAEITLYVDGESYAKLNQGIPALKSAATIGVLQGEGTGFNGEIDELEISKTARSPGFIKIAAVGQGGEKSSKLIQFDLDEAREQGGFASHAVEHVMLFGDIAKDMMFDGWAVVFFCAIMAVVSWAVAIQKFLYLNQIQKGTEEFLRQWKNMAADLTALDHSDAESLKSLGGTANAKEQRLMHQSPVYHIYHIGSEEIRHRLMDPMGFSGLSARSIEAIKASLHSSLTREVHRLNKGLIFLTISIAGGPYVGLLGTVMGVMITFAVIAKTGEVEVNSIAPGIASALLATVAGLLVAIPALFLYSFLNSKIKDAISEMQLFINEFISKMAEFYPTPADGGLRAWRADFEKEESALR